MSELADTNYGVRERVKSETALDLAIESLRTLGYATIDGGYSASEIETFRSAFEAARRELISKAGGLERLRRVDEHNTVRAAFYSIVPARTRRQ